MSEVEVFVVLEVCRWVIRHVESVPAVADSV